MTRCCQQDETEERSFWTTRLDACENDYVCGTPCGTPGLRLLDENCNPCNPTDVAPCGPQARSAFATIDTRGWIEGLALNILLTDARVPLALCGGTTATGGHWSESYITEGPPMVGSLLRQTRRHPSRAEAIAELEAFAEAALQRLVQRGVARSVSVSAEMVDDRTARMEISIWTTSAGTAQLRLAAAQRGSGWALSEAESWMTTM